MDNDSEEQSSEQSVFRNTSRAFEHALSLQPFTNIDHDRPSQTSGSVLASEVKVTGSSHTVETVRMARPSSAVIAVKKLVSSSKDNNHIISLSSSDSDSDRDSGIDELEFLHYSGMLGGASKRRAQDSLVAYSKKRPNIQLGSPQDPIWNIPDIKDFKVPQQWNHPSGRHIPSPDCSALLLDHIRIPGGGGSIQYLKSSVEPNANRAMQCIVSYDSIAKKAVQAPRTGPATADAIMKVYMITRSLRSGLLKVS